MRKWIVLLSITIAIISAWLSYFFWGLFGLLIWLCIIAFVVIDVIYHYGTKQARGGLFNFRASSNAPDPRIEKMVQGPRGWYDLDNRGRGKN